MEAMWATDRYFDFARFQETAKNVAEMMRQAGLEDVQIGQGPADGVTQNGFWTQPMAWDAHSAILEIVSPQVPEEYARSCRLSENSDLAVPVERSHSTRRRRG